MTRSSPCSLWPRPTTRKRWRNLRRPSQPEIVLILAGILAAVSSALAFHFWTERGICTDMVICAVISFLLIVSVILLVRTIVLAHGSEKLSESPIVLVMTSAPKKKAPKERQVEGKMPPELHH